MQHFFIKFPEISIHPLSLVSSAIQAVGANPFFLIKQALLHDRLSLLQKCLFGQ